MYNTRMISHAPIQQFRSLQVSSFQHSLDNTTDVLTESIIKRGAEYATDLIKKLTGKGGKKAGKETAEETAEGAEGETPVEGAEAAAKDGDPAKKDEKGKEAAAGDKKSDDKKPAEKKPPEKK